MRLGEKTYAWGIIDNGYAAEYSITPGREGAPVIDGGLYKIEIWNGMRLMEVKTTHEAKYEQYLEHLPQGVYFVRIIRDGSIVENRKLLRP